MFTYKWIKGGKWNWDWILYQGPSSKEVSSITDSTESEYNRQEYIRGCQERRVTSKE